MNAVPEAYILNVIDRLYLLIEMKIKLIKQSNKI